MLLGLKLARCYLLLDRDICLMMEKIDRAMNWVMMVKLPIAAALKAVLFLVNRRLAHSVLPL
jgi:hypothetical protein